MIEATEILTSVAKTLDFDILETMFTDEEGKLVKLKTRNQLY